MISAYHAGYVLDASVAAKWFVHHSEPDRMQALFIRERHLAGQCRLIIPEFGLLEVVHAIHHSPRAKEADGAAALELLQDLYLESRQLSWDLLRKANVIA